MAFPMSHLYIAQNILDNMPIKPKDIPHYFLGTLAPDAIHFRKNYSRSLKRKSHLYINLEKHDLEKFVESWRTNVIELFCKNKSGDNFEFLLGYCIHIMTDIYSHKNIWIPFDLKYSDRKDIDYKKIYRDESLSVDYEIFQKNNYEETIFPIIGRAQEIDFLELITKADLCGIKDNILNKQYSSKSGIKVIENKYIIKYDKTMENNNKIIEYIQEELIEKIM
jgi:hypothetical protein